MIAAMSRNRVIGRGNDLPWNLPEDLKYFREMTRGFPVVMGRKTFDSMGKPLPNRINIVVTRQEGWGALGVETFTSVGEAIHEAQMAAFERGLSQIFVIGGGEIYKLALPKAHRLFLTEVDADVQGDAFFPEFDCPPWREVLRVPGAGGELNYDFVLYEK